MWVNLPAVTYMMLLFNPSPNDEYLDWSKLNAFAYDKMNVNEQLKFGLKREENIVRKMRKCWSPAFSTFSYNVFKSFFSRGVKKSGLCGKELTLYQTVWSYKDPEGDSF